MLIADSERLIRSRLGSGGQCRWSGSGRRL